MAKERRVLWLRVCGEETGGTARVARRADGEIVGESATLRGTPTRLKTRNVDAGLLCKAASRLSGSYS